MVYAFDPGFKAKIASRSWVQRMAPLWGKVKAAAGYVARVAFGTALIASVVLVWIAVTVLLSSRSDDNRWLWG